MTQITGYWCDVCRVKYVDHVCKDGLPCGHDIEESVHVYAKYYGKGGEEVELIYHGRETGAWINNKPRDPRAIYIGSGAHEDVYVKTVEGGTRTVYDWLCTLPAIMVRAYMERWDSRRDLPDWMKILHGVDGAGYSWMQTHQGVQFWPIAPRAEDIRIEDIAHALANQCRYAGHCVSFYSVAEHSIRVSRVCNPAADALWGLLHDASEAYLVDLPRPLKHHPDFAFYRVVERRVMRAVCERFGLPLEMPESVELADDVVGATEKRDLMGPEPANWGPLPEPMDTQIVPWSPECAERVFLHRFVQLGGKEE